MSYFYIVHVWYVLGLGKLSGVPHKLMDEEVSSIWGKK